MSRMADYLLSRSDSRIVTGSTGPHTICFVSAPMLTKRRAVDFCHMATAICPDAC